MGKLSEYLKYANELKVWKEKNIYKELVQKGNSNEEERRLAFLYRKIRRQVIIPYLKYDEDKKRLYEQENPEIFEIIEIMNFVDKKEKEPPIYPYIDNIALIVNWMNKHHTVNSPSPKSSDEEEKSLGTKMRYIRYHYVNYYYSLSQNEREEFEQRYPRIKEVIDIVEQIDKRKMSIYLQRAKNVKDWIIANNSPRMPFKSSKDEYEREMAFQLSSIKNNYLKKYYKLENEGKREFERKNPDIFEVIEIFGEINDIRRINQRKIRILEKTKNIKKWMEKSDNRIPSKHSKDIEERDVGMELLLIKQNYLVPYLKITDEEEKKKYERMHPELQEVREILRWVEENSVSPYLITVRKIKELVDNNGGEITSLKFSANEEERKLIQKYNTIKMRFIIPYLQIENDEEKLKFVELLSTRRYYQISKENFYEILEIMEEIERNEEPIMLYNTRKIVSWIEKTNVLPSRNSSDEEEKTLGKEFRLVRYNLIKPYLELETEDEKREFEKIHPEIKEVIKLLYPAIRNCNNRIKHELVEQMKKEFMKFVGKNVFDNADTRLELAQIVQDIEQKDLVVE